MTAIQKLKPIPPPPKTRLARAWKRVRWAWHDFLCLKPVYWFLCHTWPSYRWHKLDIRNPDYDYGYIDPSQRLLYAGFAVLKDFVDNEKPFDVIDFEPGIESEIRALYEWWVRGRFEDRAAVNAALERWSEDYPGIDFSGDDGRYEDQRWLDFCALGDAAEAREQEMVERLVGIRNYLWS